MNYTVEKNNGHIYITDNGVDDHSEIVIPRPISTRIGVVHYHTKNAYIRPIKSHLSFRVIKLIIMYDGAENNLICDINSYHQQTMQVLIDGNQISQFTLQCEKPISQVTIKNNVAQSIHLEKTYVERLVIKKAERLYIKNPPDILCVTESLMMLINQSVQQYRSKVINISSAVPKIIYNCDIQRSTIGYNNGVIYGDLLISKDGIFPLYIDQPPSNFKPMNLLVGCI